jgi:hypothetical protein
MNMETQIEKLTPAGKLFLGHARTLRGGKLIDLDHRLYRDADGSHYPDDLTDPVVRIVSTISWSERARQYGIECLSNRSDWSGARGPQGHPIPTEDYIDLVAGAYGDEPEHRIISLHPYRRLPLTEAINRAGQDLSDCLQEGCYAVAQ